jgi:hypothetical protein
VGITGLVLLSSYLLFFNPASTYEIEINPIDPSTLGVNEWLEDFQHFYTLVEENYPYLVLKNRTHGYNWLDLKEDFENRIQNAQDNREFLDIIAAAVTALQNRHTHLLSPTRVISTAGDVANWVPFNEVFSSDVVDAAAYWSLPYNAHENSRFNVKFNALIVYDRGEYVIRDYNSTWEETYGDYTVVTHVNGIPVDNAILTCYETEYIDYDFNRSKSYIWSIYPRSFGSDAIFTIRNSTGYTGDVTFDTMTGFSYLPYDYPSSVINTTVREDISTGYLYASTFGTGIDQYYDDVIDFYQEIEDFDHLIIDIRGNTGGFYSRWINGIVSPLIDEDIVRTQHLAYRTGEYVSYLHLGFLTDVVSKDDFAYLPPEVLGDDFRIYRNINTYNPTDGVDYNGTISVLTDNVVFSAAEGFTTFCREFDFATLYGTSTGGDGITLWPLYIALPNSKLVINCASVLGLDETGHANEEVRTQPDVYFESAFGDWNALINFVIDDLTSG